MDEHLVRLKAEQLLAESLLDVLVLAERLTASRLAPREDGAVVTLHELVIGCFDTVTATAAWLLRAEVVRDLARSGVLGVALEKVVQRLIEFELHVLAVRCEGVDGGWVRGDGCWRGREVGRGLDGSPCRTDVLVLLPRRDLALATAVDDTVRNQCQLELELAQVEKANRRHFEQADSETLFVAVDLLHQKQLLLRYWQVVCHLSSRRSEEKMVVIVWDRRFHLRRSGEKKKGRVSRIPLMKRCIQSGCELLPKTNWNQ